jgi:hypothetical protein
MLNLIAFLRERGGLKARTKGSVSPYLWMVAEIAYRCRMRGIEVHELTDANWTKEGVIVCRRKGALTTPHAGVWNFRGCGSGWRAAGTKSGTRIRWYRWHQKSECCWLRKPGK